MFTVRLGKSEEEWKQQLSPEQVTARRTDGRDQYNSRSHCRTIARRAYELQHANGVVELIGDVKIALAVDRQARNGAELRTAGRTAIARVALGSIACHRCDDAGRRDHADTIVV